MNKTMKQYDYNFLDHPFWVDVTSLSKNRWIQQISLQNHDKKELLLNSMLEAFYPLTSLSPVVYYRLSNLISGRNKELAYHIYETELGKHPLLEKSSYKNISHAKQYKEFVCSLMPEAHLLTPSLLSNQFVSDNNVEAASLSQVLAMAAIIEYNAPMIIHSLGDFMVQWQVYMSLPSQAIKKNFIHEHSLLEGDDSEDQHIAMIEEILMANKGITNVDVFEKELVDFKQRYHALLDCVYSKLFFIQENMKSA